MIQHPPLYHLASGEGHSIHLLGQEEVFLQSDDSVSVFVNHFQPGMGAPMHVHHAMDEACYVLSGNVKFVSDSTSIIAGPGDWVSCKRGIPHGFVGVGSTPISLLWVCNPGGYDEFFDEASKVEIGPDGPDMAALSEVAARHRTELLGPIPSVD